METQDIKKIVLANIKIENYKPKTGGQTCGVMESRIILYSEELDLRIEFGYHRSQLKNAELAHTLFELVLDELIK
jgi:hypothetical protein